MNYGYRNTRDMWSLCPQCGAWHHGPDRLSACRLCWLGPPGPDYDIDAAESVFRRYQRKRTEAWETVFATAIPNLANGEEAT